MEDLVILQNVSASKVLHTHLQRKGFQTNSVILYSGAGTGLVGDYLLKYGYNNLDALHISEKMLEKAKKKNVYKEFFKADAMKEMRAGQIKVNRIRS